MWLTLPGSTASGWGVMPPRVKRYQVRASLEFPCLMPRNGPDIFSCAGNKRLHINVQRIHMYESIKLEIVALNLQERFNALYLLCVVNDG